MLRDPIQRGNNGRWRRGPHEEDRIDAKQASIKGLGKIEISAHYLNMWRQTSGVQVANQRADLRARGGQLRDNLAANVSGGANDEDTAHTGPSYCFASVDDVGSGFLRHVQLTRNVNDPVGPLG